MSRKYGWEKWYWKDWLTDLQLQNASPSTRGIWANVLGYMWQEDVYELTLSRAQFTRLAGCSEAEFDLFAEEAQALLFCYFSVTGNGCVTLVSRRRKRDDKRRQNNALRQQRYRRNAESNANGNGVDTDTDTEEEKKEEKLKQKEERKPSAMVGFEDWWKAYPKKVGKAPCREIWKRRRLGQMADELIADIAKRAEHDGRWLDGYIPNPQTYLNQSRWEDELQPRSKPQKPRNNTYLGKDENMEAMAAKLGLPAKPGESTEAWHMRIRAAATRAH